MLTPTHITGPDGTLCPKGEEIPADWFDLLPDLNDHLAGIVSEAETEAEPAGEASVVKAKATVGRRRGSGGTK